MRNPKFQLGQALYYKPGDFAPLQVRPGGLCTVVDVRQDNQFGFEYTVKLESGSEDQIAKESELTAS